jgi:hypothetical protein
MFLSKKTSRGRLGEAENARRNRLEIVKALSHGQITRRELFKWGLFTAGGMLAWKHGLNAFVPSAYADSSIPTGLPRSPLFGVQAFTQPMPRFDVLARNPNPATFLTPAPTKEANTTQQLLNSALEGVTPGDTGPIEGRPPGPIWAHQKFDTMPPLIAMEATTEGAKVNSVYNPQVPANLNSGIDPAQPFHPRFHPGLPDQGPDALWTFNGTLPPKLFIARYGEPILFAPVAPFDVTGSGTARTPTRAQGTTARGERQLPGVLTRAFYDYHYPSSGGVNH